MHKTIETQPSPVEIFMTSWRVYQEIIEHNYMFHQEITSAVAQQLVRFKPDTSLKILDLGCGDASMAIPLIPPERILHYLGCDLSQPALNIATKKLLNAGVPHKLICDDMLKAASKQPDHSIDLVISSYAIHHLGPSQKQTMIQEISRLLSDDGCFVLIDIFREPNEDRATYLHHYMSDLHLTWTQLSSASQKLVVDHATAYDFPETSEFYQAICQKQGIDLGYRLAKHTWHEAWAFQR